MRARIGWIYVMLWVFFHSHMAMNTELYKKTQPDIIIMSVPEAVWNKTFALWEKKHTHTLTPEKRKFCYMLGRAIWLKNQKILQQRAFVSQCMTKKNLSLQEKKCLQSLLWDHNVSHSMLFLKKVDIIPPSMALAQSIEESGWGKSFFTRKRHAYFGMRKNRRVCAYTSMQESVNAYINNLNTHNAYRTLREKRHTLRIRHKPVTGKILAGGLTGYATSKNYIKKISSIISRFSLEMLDHI